ncbi:hypothetical protein Taro_028810, partial [Colocasia esculenta]|nr:hypothetical protein [Colocasia esculenta]
KVRATIKAQISSVSMDKVSGDPTDDGDPFRFLLLLFLIPRRLRPPHLLLHQDPLERQALLQQGVVVRRPHRPPPQDRAEAYCKEIAKTFREKGIPCDVIWMDIDYMDGFRCFTFDKTISTTSSSLDCSHRPSDANIRYDIDAQLQSQYTGNPARVVRTVSMLWAKPTATTMTSEAAPDFWMRRAFSRAISHKLFTATIYSNKGFHRRRRIL